MSSSLIEMLMENLSGEPTRQLSRQVGADGYGQIVDDVMEIGDKLLDGLFGNR
jgi:hypothetical protein